MDKIQIDEQGFPVPPYEGSMSYRIRQWLWDRQPLWLYRWLRRRMGPPF